MKICSPQCMPRLRFLFSSVVLLLIGIGVQPVQAQVVVTDPGNTLVGEENALSDHLSQLEAVAEYGETLERWTSTAQHYAQQIASMQSLLNGFNLGLPISMLNTPLTEVDLEDGVEQMCHASSSGLSLSGILDSLSTQLALSSDGDIVGQQRELCSRIVIMQNMKYNEAVVLINDTMPRMTDQYTKILDNLKDIMGDTQGNQDQKANDIAAIDAETQAKLKEFEQRMGQYDAYIASLQARQRNLAQMAFKGDKGVVGTIVQTAALAGALEIND